jgi:hypothetical protein
VKLLDELNEMQDYIIMSYGYFRYCNFFIDDYIEQEVKRLDELDDTIKDIKL